MASFIAAGTSYATRGVPMVPVLHLLFDVRLPAGRRPHLAGGRHPRPAASCSAPPPGARRCSARACSTRTATASCWPRRCRRCQAYDPAFAYEVAAIVQARHRSACTAAAAASPTSSTTSPSTTRTTRCRRCPTARHRGRASSQGLYRWRRGARRARRSGPRSLFSGSAQGAARAGGGRAGRALRRRRRAVVGHVVQGAARGGARGRALEPPAPRPGSRARRSSRRLLADAPGPIVAVTDFMKIVPEQVARFLPDRPFVPLGTDGMGRSDTREALRRFFEVDAGHVVVAVLAGAGRAGRGQGRGRRRRHQPLRHRPRRGQPGRTLTRCADGR